MAERLQKILASAGIASRRKAEGLISAGRVRVNGVTANLGDSGNPATDTITLDGKPVVAEKKQYLALNKPAGYVTTLDDPQGRPKVADLVKSNLRLYPIGRLDFMTEGLLLMTNDGDFSQRVAHPSNEVEKKYVVHCSAPMPAAAVRRLSNGLVLDDGPVAALRVRVVDDERKTVEIVLHDGRNRVVRRMFEAIGARVSRLVRTQIGPLTLDGLATGGWRNLTARELAAFDSGRRKEEEGS
jgi:23S rRNA pseudouridine2605 synthase